MQEELSWHRSINRNKHLGSLERRRLVAAMMDELRDSQLDIASEEQMLQVAAETRIKYDDLDGDGKPEVIAQAGGEKSGCSPTGNCPFWVLLRQGTGYEILLRGEAQTFTVQRARTNGFSDIVLSRHGSAFESEAREFKFDGKAYRESACYDVLWSSPGSDGEEHRLPKPRFTPCGASQ
jgi:hypothetical protein